jgi:hypothetical protein
MKTNGDGETKCPHCGFEPDAKAKPVAKERVSLFPVELRPGVLDARQIVMGGRTIGYVEQISRKWRSVSAKGLPIESGLLSLEVATKSVVDYDLLYKHPGHDQSSHGNWARNPATRRRMLESKQQSAGYGKGRKIVSVGAIGTFKPKSVKMRPSVLKRIEDGWKSDLDDASLTRDDIASRTPYVPASDRTFAKGSVAEAINSLIGSFVGRADAYYRHAMKLNPATQNVERQSLLYKAEKLIQATNTVFGPALKREIERTSVTKSTINLSKAQQAKFDRLSKVETPELPFHVPAEIYTLLQKSAAYANKPMPEDLVVAWDSVDNWIDNLVDPETDEDMEKGDVPNHPFHGNQYVSADSHSIRSKYQKILDENTFTEMNPSPTYKKELENFADVAKQTQKARQLYRAKKIGDKELIDQLSKLDAAQKRLDFIKKVEQSLPETTKHIRTAMANILKSPTLSDADHEELHDLSLRLADINAEAFGGYGE